MKIELRKKWSKKSLSRYAHSMPSKYKNVCVSAIANRLGILDDSRYLQCVEDLVYNLRKEYTVRSRASMFKINRKTTVSQVRKKALILTEKVSWYLIKVDGHVLLIDSLGRVEVDTSPRKRDRRKVLKIYAVY